MTIIGIDLAWGERNHDGVCILAASARSVRVAAYHYPQGDRDVIGVVQPFLTPGRGVFITIDAPIICPNSTGTRPVDRLTHTMFHREHAACHPANSTKCPRPPRILRKLQKLGVRAGWEADSRGAVAAEVYPHPAMVRLFQLDRIVKYKRGPVRDRRREFVRLQRLLRTLLRKRFPAFSLDPATDKLLRSPWTKQTEDLTDALFCALIGLWHVQYRGSRSEVIGDRSTGFILLPADLPTVRSRRTRGA
jgi:predicted RNase H-like nuclease